MLSQERLRQATAWVRRLPRSDILDHVASIGFADPRYRFAFALIKTRLVSAMPGQDAAYLVAEATRAALGLSATAPISAV